MTRNVSGYICDVIGFRMLLSLKLITEDLMLEKMCTSNNLVHNNTTIVFRNGPSIAIVDLNKKTTKRD